MALPTQLLLDLAAFRTAVIAAKPIKRAPPLQVAALVRAGADLLSEIDAALDATSASLEPVEVGPHPLQMVDALNAARTAADDCVTLHDLRGVVGRAVFNLSAGAV